MYIGASYKCSQYCQQDDKRKYEKFHTQPRHIIIDSHAFKEDNQAFIRKSKRAWNSFSIRLQSFFKKLKNELNFIQQQAFNRLELEQIKSAINTDDKHLRNISIDIIQSRFRNLTCKDIDQFLQLRKKQRADQYVNIQREEDNFANDLIDQVNTFFRDISNDLKPKNDRKPYKDYQDHRQIRKDKEYPKQREYPREREIPQKHYPQNNEKNQEPRPREERNNRNQRQYQANRGQKKRNNDNQNYKKNQQKSEKNQKVEEPRYKRYQRDENLGRDRRNRRERDEPFQPFKKDNQKAVKDEQSTKGKDPCPLFKVNELTSSCNAFDIDLKILSFVKNLYGKQMWRVSDQSGEIMLVVPTHNAIKEGAKVRMHNCYVKSFNQKLQINTKSYSKVSQQNVKQEAIGSEYKHYKKNNDKSEKSREKNRQDKGLVKIQKITPEFENFKLIGKVVSVKVLKEQDYQCVLGDQTGIVNARFHGYDQFLQVGKMVYLRGLEVQVDDCGHMFLTGNKVLMQLAHDEIKSVKMTNDISLREYQLAE